MTISKRRVARAWLDAEHTFVERARQSVGGDGLLGTEPASPRLRPATWLSLSLQPFGASQDQLAAPEQSPGTCAVAPAGPRQASPEQTDSRRVGRGNASPEPGGPVRSPIAEITQERSLWERVDAQSQRGVRHEERSLRAQEARPRSPTPPLVLNLHLGYPPGPVRAAPSPPAPSDDGAEAAVLVEGLTREMRQLQSRLQRNIEGMKLAELALSSPELSDGRATPGSSSLISTLTPPSNTSSTIPGFQAATPEFPKRASLTPPAAPPASSVSPSASALHTPTTPSLISGAATSAAASSATGMRWSAFVGAGGEMANFGVACARERVRGTTPPSTCATSVASAFPRATDPLGTSSPSPRLSPQSEARERMSFKGSRSDMETGIGQKFRSSLGLQRTAMLVWRRHLELQASARHAAGASLTWTNHSVQTRAVLVVWRQAVRLVGGPDLPLVISTLVVAGLLIFAEQVG